jgi:hypothetical protein
MGNCVKINSKEYRPEEEERNHLCESGLTTNIERQLTSLLYADLSLRSQDRQLSRDTFEHFFDLNVLVLCMVRDCGVKPFSTCSIRRNKVSSLMNSSSAC